MLANRTERRVHQSAPIRSRSASCPSTPRKGSDASLFSGAELKPDITERLRRGRSWFFRPALATLASGVDVCIPKQSHGIALANDLGVFGLKIEQVGVVRITMAITTSLGHDERYEAVA